MEYYLKLETLHTNCSRLSRYPNFPQELDQQLLKHLGHLPESLTDQYTLICYCLAVLQCLKLKYLKHLKSRRYTTIVLGKQASTTLEVEDDSMKL